MMSATLKSCQQKVAELFADYSHHSTVHGFNYIGEKGRSCYERIWWTVVFCISLVCCAQFVNNAWNINPIIISFSAKPMPIWQTPFPVVTICPHSFTRDARFNLTKFIAHFHQGEKDFENLSDLEKLQLGAMNLFCLRRLMFGPVMNLTNCNNCLSALRDILIPLEDQFVECKFNNQVFNCKEHFQQSVLNHYLCYDFNGLDVYRKEANVDLPQEWSIDDGYSPTATLDAYPRRALGSGSGYSLSILLRANEHEIDPYCTGMSGFQLNFQMPYESPSAITDFFGVQMEQYVTFLLKPGMMVTSKELRHYTPEKRNCYFSNERRLKYLTQYTQRNCEIECEVDAVLTKCGCFPLYIENVLLTKGSDICGPRQFPCYVNAIAKTTTQLYSPCHCLPTCSSITFESEIAVAQLNKSALPVRYRNQHEGVQYSQVTIYIKDNQLIPLQRKELYGSIDFLANFGGLLGLFFGVSFLSCLEIVYFCTIRLYFNMRRVRIDAREQEEVEEVDGTQKMQTNTRLRSLLSEYIKKTTIHGIAHVFDRNSSLVERTWWAIVVVASVLTCGYLVSSTLRRYSQSPVIVSHANEETRISEIPFPAITMCPQIVYHDIGRMYYVFKYMNTSLYTYDKESIDMVTSVSQVCDPQLFSDIDPNNQTDCANCAVYLRRMMGGFWNVIYNCAHMDVDVSDMVKEVVTEEGVCYTYNGLEIFRASNEANIEEWTLDGGYRSDANLTTPYPRPGTRSNFLVSFGIQKLMIDGLCKTGIQGTKVYLHMPNEAPQMSKNFFLVPFDKYVRVSIKPKVMVIDSELRNLPVAKRQCYFGNERNLRFFRNYTQNNCEHECVANLTVSQCGCLTFYMPKIPGVKLCGISDIGCYRPILQQRMKETQASDCNCLKTCTSISYDTEIIQVALSKFKDNLFVLDPEYTSGRILSRVKVHFKENHFIAMKRSQIYGGTELLANCGGLLGLFLGFSLMSVFELIYFTSVRLVCNLRMHVQTINRM